MLCSRVSRVIQEIASAFSTFHRADLFKLRNHA